MLYFYKIRVWYCRWEFIFNVHIWFSFENCKIQKYEEENKHLWIQCPLSKMNKCYSDGILLQNFLIKEYLTDKVEVPFETLLSPIPPSSPQWHPHAVCVSVCMCPSVSTYRKKQENKGLFPHVCVYKIAHRTDINKISP